MTNKKFVLSCYPEAICDVTELNNGKLYCVFQNNLTNKILGYSEYSSTIAWRSASIYLRELMLEKLES
jgi:hypothetical protein